MFVNHVARRIAARRWQYTLRWALIAIAGMALLFAVVGNRARSRRDAVAAILAGGGKIVYDHQLQGRAVPDGPAWLRPLLGDDFFASVAEVDLARQAAAVDLLPRLPALGGLRALNLRETPISNDGLAPLARLAKLRKLVLRGTPITDTGLAHLARLRALEELDLAGTRVAGPGLAHLDGLPELQTLDMMGTPLADGGLDALARLDSLTKLDLGRTQITDAGLARLQRLARLQSLNLWRARIGDQGLAHLERMPALQRVDLDESDVTDAGIAAFQQAMPSAWTFNRGSWSSGSLAPGVGSQPGAQNGSRRSENPGSG